MYESIEQYKPQLVRMMFQSRNNNTSKFPLRTFLHGEPWERNLVFRTEPITESVEVVICDWKLASLNNLGNPCQDLAFLVVASTDLVTRNRHVKTALEKYFLTYTETLRKFGVRLREDYAFDDFKRDFQDELLGAFLRAVPLLIREERYLEAENYNAESESAREELGVQLKAFGRRLVELAEEFVPQVMSRVNRTGTKVANNANVIGNLASVAVAAAANDRNNNSAKKA